MDRKAVELGGKYTYRDLAADAHIDDSYAVLLVQGKRQPSRSTVATLVHALVPYLNEDSAMLAAGYTPHGVPRSLFQRVIEEWRSGEARDQALIDEEERRAGHGPATE